MDQKIQTAPAGADLIKGAIQRSSSSTSTSIRKSESSDCRQWLDTLAEGLALIGECQLGALVGQRLRDPQAIERSFCDPITRPRFPFNKSPMA